MNTPIPITADIRKNLITYSAFLLLAVLGIIYGSNYVSPYPYLRVWDWSNLLILLLGLPLLFFQSKAGLPDFWSASISNWERLGYPILIGICFGVADVLVIKWLMHPEPYTELPPFLQPFPYSIFLYGSGAFDVEVFYRLVPITLFLLAGQYWWKGNYSSGLFCVIAILTSVREPLEQMPSGNWLFISYSLATGFAMNFLQAIWFKRAGFVATLAVRLGHYLIWHILLGLYVELIELGKFN